MLVSRGNNAKLGFGYKLAVDSGASDTRRGSLKITMFSDDGEKLISSNRLKGFPTNVCPNGIMSSSDYLNGLKNRIKDFINNEKIKDKISRQEGDGNLLKGIALFVPGATVNNIAKILPNLKDKDNNPLRDVDFKDIKKINKDTDINVLALNDMAGAAAFAAKRLKSLYNGLKAAVCMTGGGCGVASIKVVNGETIVVTTELGHVRGLNNRKSVEKEGASVPAMINNYAESLSLSENDKKKLLGVGNAKVVTQYPLILDKNTKEANNLKETGLFEEKIKNNKVEMTLKNVTKEKHAKASKEAINAYLDSVAQIAHIEAAKGTNEFILTGPLVQGVKKATQNLGMNFDQEIRDRAIKLLGPGGQAMADLYKFNVSSIIEIPDNTLGGPSLLNGNFVSEARGNWVGIPTRTLKDKDKVSTELSD